MHIYTYICTHTHIYAHTHTHTYIHTHAQLQKRLIKEKGFQVLQTSGFTLRS